MVSSAEALRVGSQAVGGKVENRFSANCRFCNASYWSYECTKYDTTEKRKQKIKGCCFKCLWQRHGAKDCRKRVVCAHCSKRNHHHRSLFPQKFGTAANEQANVAEEIEPEEIEPEETEQEDEDPHTENSLISSGEMVLMQTARANISNPNNGLKENVRLLLDSGRQRTYVTESLAKKMDLKMGQKEEIMLVTFGSDTPKGSKRLPLN